jgi:hypothetical protein
VGLQIQRNFGTGGFIIMKILRIKDISKLRYFDRRTSEMAIIIEGQKNKNYEN